MYLSNVSHLIVVTVNVSAAGFSNERVYTHYSIKNHYFTANLVIPYINSLINRLTLKSVKLIHYMTLISLLLNIMKSCLTDDLTLPLWVMFLLCFSLAIRIRCLATIVANAGGL